MTRMKRGYIARRRRTKMRLFASSFRGAHSRLTRTITQQKIRACFIAIVINRCCFKVNLFTRLDNIFPCSLINRLIKLMFL